MIGNWRTIDNQEIPSVSAISGSGLVVARGVFELSANGNQLNARFYGTDHERVGGVFSNATIIWSYKVINLNAGGKLTLRLPSRSFFMVADTHLIVILTRFRKRTTMLNINKMTKRRIL